MPTNIEYSSGGGGSGYIGNANTFNKKMVGYNVTTSSDEGTKTLTTTKHSISPISNYAKQGNGYVRITYLGPLAPVTQQYLFNPNFNTDGRDTVRYDENNLIEFDASGTSESVVEGSLFSLEPDYTVSNGVLSIGDIYEVDWVYDMTKNQSVIPSNADVIISCDIRFDDEDFIDGNILTFWMEGEGDDVNLSMRIEMLNVSDNESTLYFGDGTNYVYTEASDIFNDEPNVNVWYQCKYVIHLVGGYISGVDYYFDDVLKATQTFVNQVPFFNVTGTQNQIDHIAFASRYSDVSIKNLSIQYE